MRDDPTARAWIILVWQAPVWLSGFNWALGLYCLLLMALFLIPALRS